MMVIAWLSCSSRLPRVLRRSHGRRVRWGGGLVLLLIALLTPLVAAVRARHRPTTAIAAGAYVAFLVHAGVDWDWELTAVTLTGLLCGVALLIAARRDENTLRLGQRRYALVA